MRSRVLVIGQAAFWVWLAGCSSSPDFVAKYEPWRAEEESACIASGVARASSHVLPRSALGGPSLCGTERPFEMTAALDGRVALKPAALLRCPMIPQVERWVRNSIEPAAYRHFGMPVTEVSVAGSYSCRAMNHVSGARLSEHGYANALDVSGFRLADGRMVSVKRGWRGEQAEQAFLRDVQDGACREFTTVLSPDYDRNHHDHLHVDLARHGRDGLKGICK